MGLSIRSAIESVGAQREHSAEPRRNSGRDGPAVKRLSGWDALLLYSETPNVHQHTLKVAVVDTSDFQGEPTFEVFRETLRRRLPLLEPLRYQLVGFPLQRPV